ncbi:MAG TPA: methyltransferase domain-containing protein [Chitinophaga sp.]|uniref:class I SAM-dependent methyltransferase n=1 Tax=Chitinophaga sp. TaxID=1869181 RepID=UPI002B52B179|nr:methyltransferase domain-containing protein [Chitinophaga sp.]HVI43449.1 methyltransferase domain-containing protein [Chitinophaga sp.]
MNISDATALIRQPELQQQGVWADLGCGSGVFTYALSEVLRPGSTVYGIDKTLTLEREITRQQVEIIPIQADFVTDHLPLQQLDGLLMANSLHYVKDKKTLLQQLQQYLKPGGRFIIVEYDTDTAVPVWVPYPLSFTSLTTLFHNAGYHSIIKTGNRHSVYGRADMYAALIS